MKSLPKEKRDRLILVIIAATAAIVGIYYGVVTSQRRSLQALAKRRAEQEGKLKGAERLAASVSQFQKNLEDSAGKVKAIEATMASGDMYSWVILTINSFKENYRIDIPQFSREVPCEVGLLPKFPYRAALFHVRGSAYYEDLGRFVAGFENTFPYMRIQNIELEPASASSANRTSDQEKLAFKMEIVALVNPNSH
jgi:hypothetical protein